MKFVFIDEVESSQKNPKFLGMGAIIVNSNNYHKYKEHFDTHFKKLGWDNDIEFKGKYLFSKSGDANVPVEKRIDFVREIAAGFNASKNARLKCLFCCGYDGNSDTAYLSILSCIISKIKKEGSGHKKVIAYFVDKNQRVEKKKALEVIDNSKPGGIEVFERPFFVDSDNSMPGIIAVDVFCYLKSWVTLNPKEDDQLQLFAEFTEADKKKLSIIKEILSSIKNIKDVNK